jgi:hypothetical protein
MSKRKAEDDETQVTKKQKTVKLNDNARFFRWACTVINTKDAWKEWKLMNRGPWTWEMGYRPLKENEARRVATGRKSVFDLRADQEPTTGWGTFNYYDETADLPFPCEFPEDNFWIRLRLKDYQLDYIEEKGIRVLKTLERATGINGTHQILELIYDYAIPSLFVAYFETDMYGYAKNVAQFETQDEQLKHQATILDCVSDEGLCDVCCSRYRVHEFVLNGRIPSSEICLL